MRFQLPLIADFAGFVLAVGAVVALSGCGSSAHNETKSVADSGRSGFAGGASGSGGTRASVAGAGNGGVPTSESGSGAGGRAAGGNGGVVASGGGTGGSASSARIACLGDSITEQAASWIYPFQDALRAQGCRYELIGHDGSPYNGPYRTRAGYDNVRVAAGGFSTTGILNWIKEDGMGGVPDVVVEYLGVNNVYGGFIDGHYNPDDSADPSGTFTRDNKELVTIVRAQNPRAIFILMKIENHALPVIDSAIDGLVASESTRDSPVIAAVAADGVETVDGIHPTQAGSAVLAGPVSAVADQVLAEHGFCR